MNRRISSDGSSGQPGGDASPASPSTRSLRGTPAPDEPAEPLTLEVHLLGRSVVREIRRSAVLGRLDPKRGTRPEVDLARDRAVSRQHARIVARNGCYWIRDLESLNGTVLNDLELTPGRDFPLASGDELFLGEFTRIRVLRAPVPADEEEEHESADQEAPSSVPEPAGSGSPAPSAPPGRRCEPVLAGVPLESSTSPPAAEPAPELAAVPENRAADPDERRALELLRELMD